MEDCLYRALSIGLNRRQLIKVDSEYLNNVFNIIAEQPHADYYESIYLYSNNHYQDFLKTKKLSGIRGIKTDRLVFDFDSKNNVELAQSDTLELIKRLNKHIVSDNIQIYYSGNKGFHVIVNLTEYIDRNEFENITSGLASGLETFDATVKDEQRILRFPLTRHQISGKYKVPLTIQQLSSLDIEEIRALASRNDEDDFYDIMDNWSTVKLPEEFRRYKEVQKVNVVTPVTDDVPDLSRKPKHLTPAKYVLQEGFFEEGERNEACMILASTYRYLGYNKELAYNMLKATLRLRAARLGLDDYNRDELWVTIIETVYSPAWKGGVYTEESGLLKKIIERFQLQKTVSDGSMVNLNEVSSFFREFAVNIEKNTIKLGLDEIDQKVTVTTSMLVAFLGAPSSGKTGSSFSIINNMSNRGEKSIFFSLDMALPQVFQRLIQRHTAQTSKTIMDNYKNNNLAAITGYETILNREYKNVKFCFKSGITTRHIREAIIYERDVTGVLPKLVAIDYLECIVGEISDPNASRALIATQLKDIANEFGICIWLLVQPTKHTGGPECELNSYINIKGSSVIGEAASVVFTMSRPGFSPKSPENDRYATISVVKNRMGPLSSTDFRWDGLTGTLRKLSTEEYRDLQELRKELAENKNKEATKELF